MHLAGLCPVQRLPNGQAWLCVDACREWTYCNYREKEVRQMDLRDLQYEVGEWHKGHFPDATTTNIVLKLVEEVGELAKAHNENLAEGTGDRRVKVMDAIGDVTIVLAALCAKIGLSYGLVVQHVWAEVQTRSDERVQRKGDE